MTRKEAVKKAKEENSIKDRLRADIAQFLADYKESTTSNMSVVFRRMLEEGFRGYNKYRNKELIKEFDDLFIKLNDPKEVITFYEQFYGSWNEDKQTKRREAYIQVSNELMDRLMEEIFKLE